MKTTKQREPCPPRAMCSSEALVLFVTATDSPPVDDDAFHDAFNSTVEGLLGSWFGCWKVLRVPNPHIVPPSETGGMLQLPREVVSEIQAWAAVQARPESMTVSRIIRYRQVHADAIVIIAPESDEEITTTKPTKPAGVDIPTVKLGGKEYHVGQRMTEDEAEDFVQAIIRENPGPVTVETADASTNKGITSQIEDWTDFTQGPQKNEESFHKQVEYLQREGYLAFDRDVSGVLRCRTPYRALKAQYFDDFSAFNRQQEIPSKYFQPTSSQTTVFVSHRWATLAHPDPSGLHFRIVQDLSRRDPSKTFWYDYSCLPQAPFTESEQLAFRESVRNLNSLIMLSQFYSIITDDYETRAWCFYEWAISSLLTGGKRGQARPKDVSIEHLYNLVSAMVVEGDYPQLSVTKNEDMADINSLLTAGVALFKTLALGTTLDALNSFGFSFGVGIAARFSDIIDFHSFWEVWQILAGSSNHSGIQLAHLNDKERLTLVLKERHEQFETHARIYAEMDDLVTKPLDMRMVEQSSQDRLLVLVAEARRLGPVPSAYTTLAIIKLLYTLAVTRDTPSDIMQRLDALVSQLNELRGKPGTEMRDFLLRVQKEEPKLYEAFGMYMKRFR